MLTSSLNYHLPPECIATAPAQPRDSAKLLWFDRARDRVEHLVVRDLAERLGPRDALVFNTTAVMPARLVLRRASGKGTEGLALEQVASGPPAVWRLFLRNAGRMRQGELLTLEDAQGVDRGDRLRLLERDAEAWLGTFLLGEKPCDEQAVLDLLGRSGHVPLPPYILGARRKRGEAEERDSDVEWYQTAYADMARRRSVAAPTAGLHFTPGLLDRLDERGVRRIDVTLHVGPGTFKPVEAERLEDHPMHAEHYEVSAEAMRSLRLHRAAGGRIMAIGTTSVRTLESLPDPIPDESMTGQTRLLIAPGHRFQHVDALMTNFHLPRSTLLALVAALTGLDRLKALYAEAIERGYRFYSYGDAMVVV